MSRLLLVRHAESTWNAAGRWQGQADPPLSERGATQARSAARAVARPRAVWTSDLRRAAHTAEIMAGHHGVGTVIEPRVRERHAGEWTGLTRAEIDERFPGFLAERRRPGGFESTESLLARALGAITEALVSLDGGFGVMVTHGGVIYAVERHLGATPVAVPNLGGRFLESVDGVLALGERIVLVDPHDVEVTTPRQL